MSSPLISVVMPVRNAYSHINDALGSAGTCLDGTAHEILVADGGSTDGTVDYLETRPYGARLVSRRDTSLYDGLNKAIAAATGRYILWLNGDDRLARDGVAQLAAMARAPNAAAIISGEAIMERQGQAVWTSDNGATALSLSSVLFGVPIINCRLIERTAIAAIGGFRPQVGLGADRDLLYRLVRTGASRAHVGAVSYIYGAHPSSLTMAGSWDSYIAVHASGLQLAGYLGAEAGDADEQRLVRSFAFFSRLARARANAAAGHLQAACADACRCAFTSLDPRTVAQMVRLRQHKGRASGA